MPSPPLQPDAAFQRLNVTRISGATVSKEQPSEDAGRIGFASFFLAITPMMRNMFLNLSHERRCDWFKSTSSFHAQLDTDEDFKPEKHTRPRSATTKAGRSLLRLRGRQSPEDVNAERLDIGSFINIPKNNRLDDTSSKRVLCLIAIDDSRNFGVLLYPEMHLVLMLIRLRCIVNARTG